MNAKRLVLVFSEDDDASYVYGVLPRCKVVELIQKIFEKPINPDVLFIQVPLICIVICGKSIRGVV